jgi:hypothetical protein
VTKNRCSPITLVLSLAIGAFLICAATAQAVAAAGPGSSQLTAAVSGVQPAISGLFQVHTPRAWTDALGESGQPGANGVPDFLDSWQAFRAREDSAILKNAYAFRTIDGQGDDILYAGVQRTSSGGPSKVVFEFNQKPEMRLVGDLRIDAEIDADGNVGTARFESYSGESKGSAKFLSLAILAREGCNDAGTACIVANGALLEVGINLSQLSGESKKRFSGIQITTPEDAPIHILLDGIVNGCVTEVSGFGAGCTANDVSLTSVVSLQIAKECSGGTNAGGLCTIDAQCPGGTCAAGSCTNLTTDTVTFTATGTFVLTTQTRYDIGLYISTDGDPNLDLARSGLCERFSFPNGDGDDVDGDQCADITQASGEFTSSFGPVTVLCRDKDGDSQLDIYHCETWGNNAAQITSCVGGSRNGLHCGGASDCPGGTCSGGCLSAETVRTGTPSKCNCGLLQGACIAVPDSNVCTTEVCLGHCSVTTATTCADSSGCPEPETCVDIHVQHIDNSSRCNDNNVCTTDTCDATNGCTNTAGAQGNCNDNNVCTTDTCDATNGCTHTAGAQGDCNDNNACTTDTCDPLLGCQHNGTCGGGLIAPTATTCSDFTSPTASSLDDIFYGVKNGEINNVAPGVLFYYTHLTDVVVGDTITIQQTEFCSGNGCPLPFFGVHQGQVKLYTAGCTNSSCSTNPIVDSDAGTITFTMTCSGDFILGIKYDPGTVVGESVGSPLPEAVYNFQTFVGTNQVETDPNGVNLLPKP